MRVSMLFLLMAVLLLGLQSDVKAGPKEKAAAAFAMALAHPERQRQEDPSSASEDLSFLPPGSQEISPGLFQIPGGCLWGTYEAVERESLRTGKPVVVHIGKRIEGMCHAASHDKWLHVLTQEYMGHKDGASVLIPENGVLMAVHYSAGLCSVSNILASTRNRLGSFTTGAHSHSPGIIQGGFMRMGGSYNPPMRYMMPMRMSRGKSSGC